MDSSSESEHMAKLPANGLNWTRSTPIWDEPLKNDAATAKLPRMT
jgi:hypothetical protein